MSLVQKEINNLPSSPEWQFDKGEELDIGMYFNWTETKSLENQVSGKT